MTATILSDVTKGMSFRMWTWLCLSL